MASLTSWEKTITAKKSQSILNKIRERMLKEVVMGINERVHNVVIPNYFTETTDTHTWIREKEMRKNKWEFKAAAPQFIDFDKIAEELSGEHPIIFVNHGKTDKYVVIKESLLLKARVVGITSPKIVGVPLDKLNGYGQYLIDGEFVEWLKWARQVKSASWPLTQRKNDVVEVSTPQV